MDRPTKTQPNPIFFAKPSELHAWLEKSHDKASEIWVGFHKKLRQTEYHLARVC
ncbi:MAG TPA: hypothetical protein VNA15_12800 [Candidatus Angelobacter sp.]|nr:hypothetical protein [Candidatus Angelobacter sp.]